MTPSGSKKKIANSLVAMSSAAVLAVYAAGYTRTRSAATRLDAQAAERTGAAPVPPLSTTLPTAPAQSTAAPEAASAPRPIASTKPAPAVARVTVDSAPPSPAETLTPTPAPPSTILQAAPQANPAPQPAAPAVEPKAEVAAAAPAPPAPAPAPPAPALKDGTYTGWGSSRHGDIQASVIIQGGRIESATIAQCRTRYSCNVIDRLPPEVAERQSPEVDYVSGATQSANAFYYAVVEALSKAK